MLHFVIYLNLLYMSNVNLLQITVALILINYVQSQSLLLQVGSMVNMYKFLNCLVTHDYFAVVLLYMQNGTGNS